MDQLENFLVDWVLQLGFLVSVSPLEAVAPSHSDGTAILELADLSTRGSVAQEKKTVEVGKARSVLALLLTRLLFTFRQVT